MKKLLQVANAHHSFTKYHVTIHFAVALEKEIYYITSFNSRCFLTKPSRDFAQQVLLHVVVVVQLVQ